jgi:hypothetical protein
VTLPNGSLADAASYADLAIRSMLVHWPELTVDQRRALATVLNTSGASTVALRGDAAPAQLTADLVNASPGPQQQLQVKVQQALLDEAKRLKRSLSDVGCTSDNTRQLWQLPIDGSPAVMIAAAPPDSNPPWELVTVLPLWITDHSVLTLDLWPPANASQGSQQPDLVLVASAVSSGYTPARLWAAGDAAWRC